MLREHKIRRSEDYRDIPLITTFIDGRKIIVPLSHNIAFYKKRHKDYDTHIIKICNYIMGSRKLNFVDVGANVGDSLINLNITENSKYLLVEGDSYFYQLIDINLKDYGFDYRAVNCLLSDSEGEASYRIQKKTSSASLIVTNSLEDRKSFYTLDHILERENFKPTILKIDTDGFDLKVLRGSSETLKNEKPVIFFEWWCKMLINKQEEPCSIFRFLHKFGYRECIIFDNYGTIISKIATNDTENLELLSQYSCREDKQICYFDVLLFHEEDTLNASDFISFIKKVQ